MDRTLAPNTTQFPNVLTDQLMPLVSGDEWKVIHYGVRYALGHRSNDTLSIAQIARGRQAEDGVWLDRGTGLSDDAVKVCLAFLCDEAHIFLREDRPRKPHGYRLNPDLSSVNWGALNQRMASAGAPLPATEAALAAAPAAGRGKPPSAALPARPVELPVSDVRLDGSERPVIEQLTRSLTREEGRTFEHLLALAQKLSVGPVDDVAWVLYRLWRTYGFRRLHNAFQSPAASSLEEVSKSCLVGVVAEMLEAEQFGPITQAVRDKLVVLADEWPALDDWQEAIRSAVLYNSRRLATVEKNLKRRTAAPAPPGVKNGEPPPPAPGRRRPARRQSEWSSDELRARREAERDQDWTPPPD